MTDLIVRKLRFAFASHPVPFVWNEANPAFSSMANAVSFLAIGFEKMIGSMIPEAMPHISDPAVAEEADAFVRQEGQHAMAHRQHAKGLIKTHPALKETLDKVVAAFDDMTANTPLKYRLAYTADLEATFTPVFKLMLDHDDTLFAPGDDRVASLFLWHFVEEVEHRSSALTIYDAVVD
ncbi:MAG: metal-dependent hydrolase, partial [Mycobacterium sp.]